MMSFATVQRYVRHRELKTILAVLFVAALGWGFTELAAVVMSGSTMAVDETILLALRSPGELSDPVGPRWLEEMGRDFTALGGVAVLTLLTMLVSGYLALQGKKRAALFVVGAVVSGVALSAALKVGFDRPRPDLVPHGSIVYTKSFPSGHSMMSAVTYLTLGALLMRTQRRTSTRVFLFLGAVFLTVLVGMSRVYLGVHWPTDVLAGWTAGAMWAATCWIAARRLQREGHVEATA